jgi:hypothetical protein
MSTTPKRCAERRTLISVTRDRRRDKDALIPRRFSNNSLPPFCPLTLHLPAPPHPVVPQAALSSTYILRAPPSSQQHRYDVVSGNNAAARPAGSYSLHASVALPRPSDPCVDPCAMMLVKRVDSGGSFLAVTCWEGHFPFSS